MKHKSKPYFTKRESDVAKLVEKGYTNKEVAVQLNVSTHTVKAHLVSLFMKINCTNRTELAFKWRNKRGTLVQ